MMCLLFKQGGAGIVRNESAALPRVFDGHIRRNWGYLEIMKIQTNVTQVT
jgi:hypothetical protein